MWKTYFQPATLPEALQLLDANADARLIAGGTDVIVELSRGIRPTQTLIDLTAIRELRYVRDDVDAIALGALATHNDVLAARCCHEKALPLVQACIEVGAPQIRTRATVVGNVVTASPANDTITALLALGAELCLIDGRGERTVKLDDFYPGFRQTALRAGELVREIRLPAMRSDQRGIFLKLGLRRAQAISVIDLAIVLTMGDDRVQHARIALGCLAPVVVRAGATERYLTGRRLDEATCAQAGRVALDDVSPISDIRGSAEYRRRALAALVADGLRRIADAKEAEGLPHSPVLLETPVARRRYARFANRIETVINGHKRSLDGASGKTLLAALREDAGLYGAKEGCAEGECGACTVWLDGQAVMSCLVPAAQAHNAEVTTIEGLARDGALHPLQQSYIECGAVQCGFCIPGMLMAGAKLLEERVRPTLPEHQAAISGNICRCTGYRKILDAMIATAATMQSKAPQPAGDPT